VCSSGLVCGDCGAGLDVDVGLEDG